MPINSKQKGKSGELELKNLLNSYGYKTERTAQYCGKAEDGDADVRGLDGIHIECKRVEKLNIDTAMEQAIRDCQDGRKPTVFHRKNRKPWLVTMRFEDWIELYKGYMK